MLFSEPKIPQRRARTTSNSGSSPVSVLFSEPKIPQTELEKAEAIQRLTFQCSSASRKFLKDGARPQHTRANRRFSALQRAENSSNVPEHRAAVVEKLFQCSSASRKFLKSNTSRTGCGKRTFQCSSASRKFLKVDDARIRKQRVEVSVLFSEPKIPQISRCCATSTQRLPVSVLFSEPKIPQMCGGIRFRARSA